MKTSDFWQACPKCGWVYSKTELELARSTIIGYEPLQSKMKSCLHCAPKGALLSEKKPVSIDKKRSLRLTPYERDLVTLILTEVTRKKGQTREITFDFSLPEMVVLPALLRKFQGIK